jgi:hypothetical protein
MCLLMFLEVLNLGSVLRKSMSLCMMIKRILLDFRLMLRTVFIANAALLRLPKNISTGTYLKVVEDPNSKFKLLI